MANIPLPPLGEDIAAVIGLDGLLALVAARRGQRLTIPVDAAPEHPLASALGPERWDKLRASFAGETIDVPILSAHRIALLHTAIRADRRGATVNQLVERYGISGRHIKRICAADPDPDDPQGDLFGGRHLRV
jgi:hypothetical protein